MPLTSRPGSRLTSPPGNRCPTPTVTGGPASGAIIMTSLRACSSSSLLRSKLRSDSFMNTGASVTCNTRGLSLPDLELFLTLSFRIWNKCDLSELRPCGETSSIVMSFKLSGNGRNILLSSRRPKYWRPLTSCLPPWETFLKWTSPVSDSLQAAVSQTTPGVSTPSASSTRPSRVRDPIGTATALCQESSRLQWCEMTSSWRSPVSYPGMMMGTPTGVTVIIVIVLPVCVASTSFWLVLIDPKLAVKRV